ncbi:MAG: MATE family efflux transporter [Proteobacteria bacterium]|nr:MATE family efflux transporter [Pseudomonadota bacterium]
MQSRKSEFLKYLTLSLPLVAAFLSQKGMQFIDTVMMGWIGPSGLAAGALATNIFITLTVFCRGALSTVGVSIVHARAREQYSDISSLLFQAGYLSLILSVPIFFLIWISPYFLVAWGQDPAVVEQAKQLIHGLAWGVPGFLLFYTMREYISAFALARAIMVVSLIAIPLTFIANYVLIYGRLGLPALGVAGIGYAGSLIGWFMFFALLWYSLHNSILKQYLTWHYCAWNWNKLKNLWVTGLPSGIILILDMAVFLISAFFIGRFGVNALAAFQIALQSVTIAFNLPLAISIVTALESGHAYTAKDSKKVKRIVSICLIMGLTTSIIISILLITFPHLVISIFVPNGEHMSMIMTSARAFLFIAGLILCFDGSQVIIIGALRGLNDTFTPMVISVFCYLFIGLTSAYLLGFHTHLGAAGVWYGLFLGIASLCIIVGWRLKLKLKSI